MSDIIVSYKGSPIGTIDDSGSHTVDCQGSWLEDDISIQYVKPGYSYVGKNPVKVATFPKQIVALSDTDYATWVPSTTAATIKSSADAGTISIDLANYNYCIIWFLVMNFAYGSGATNMAKIIKQCQSIQQCIYKRPGSLSNLNNKNYNANRCDTLLSTSGLYDFYNTSGSHTMTYGTGAGITLSPTAATFSSSTSDTPTLTVKYPSITAKCHASYFSTANAGNVDESNSEFAFWGEVWRVDKPSAMFGMYQNIVDIYNE